MAHHDWSTKTVDAQTRAAVDSASHVTRLCTKDQLPLLDKRCTEFVAGRNHVVNKVLNSYTMAQFEKGDVKYIGQLIARSKDELTTQFPHISPLAMDSIRSLLNDAGLDFGMPAPAWQAPDSQQQGFKR